MINTNDIEKLMDEKIRPYLKDHLGDAEIKSFENGVLKVQMKGECSGCPSAQMTFEEIVEAQIKEAFPEVESVVMCDDISDELYAFAKKILSKDEKKD